MKRISIYFKGTGEQMRELHNISRNGYGDILLSLDGGETVQFTPRDNPKSVQTPTADNIRYVSQSTFPFIMLTDCAIYGTMRIIPAVAPATAAGVGSTKEELLRIGDKHWPLVKRVCKGCGAGPVGECPKTPKEIDKWQRGPKVWQWNELLQFRGFRVWLSFTEKENPSLFESVGEAKQAEPGRVLEILSPTRAKYSVAGLVNVALRVERFSAEGAPPLTLDEIKAVGEIIDWMEGRTSKPPHKTGRKIKDPRPLPGPDARAEYTNKIWDLIPIEHSDRALAGKVVAWARERGEKDPAVFGRFKILGESVLAKEAGKLRKDWAKERAKRHKR